MNANRCSQASAKRSKIRPEPISTDRSQAESIAGFASRGMELQTVTLRYKRGPRRECITHDDVVVVSSLENDPIKILGRVKVGQPGTVTGAKWR
jgi:hypothetical protein